MKRPCESLILHRCNSGAPRAIYLQTFAVIAAITIIRYLLAHISDYVFLRPGALRSSSSGPIYLSFGILKPQKCFRPSGKKHFLCKRIRSKRIFGESYFNPSAIWYRLGECMKLFFRIQHSCLMQCCTAPKPNTAGLLHFSRLNCRTEDFQKLCPKVSNSNAYSMYVSLHTKNKKKIRTLCYFKNL